MGGGTGLREVVGGSKGEGRAMVQFHSKIIIGVIVLVMTLGTEEQNRPGKPGITKPKGRGLRPTGGAMRQNKNDSQQNASEATQTGGGKTRNETDSQLSGTEVRQIGEDNRPSKRDSRQKRDIDRRWPTEEV
jgi:hypothetical protein